MADAESENDENAGDEASKELGKRELKESDEPVIVEDRRVVEEGPGERVVEPEISGLFVESGDGERRERIVEDD